MKVDGGQKTRPKSSWEVRAEKAEADRDKLLVALKCCIDSAVPHPDEHQKMFKAWMFANQVIATIGE